MNVFYEEDGAFKVGAVLADHDTAGGSPAWQAQGEGGQRAAG
jgi:hypothetical protein